MLCLEVVPAAWMEGTQPWEALQAEDYHLGDDGPCPSYPSARVSLDSAFEPACGDRSPSGGDSTEQGYSLDLEKAGRPGSLGEPWAVWGRTSTLISWSNLI